MHNIQRFNQVLTNAADWRQDARLGAGVEAAGVEGGMRGGLHRSVFEGLAALLSPGGRPTLWGGSHLALDQVTKRPSLTVHPFI